MKRIYPKLLKKLSVLDIKELRQMYINGVDIENIATEFGIHKTTVIWHLGELKKDNWLEI